MNKIQNLIIDANPCKQASQIKYASSHGVQKMTFDSEVELMKVARCHENAKLVLRIATDDSNAVCPLSVKFGATLKGCRSLLQRAKELSLDVIGVSFHVGSMCRDPSTYTQAISDARCVFDMARSKGEVRSRFSHTAFPAVLPSLSPTALVTRGRLDPAAVDLVQVVEVEGLEHLVNSARLMPSALRSRACTLWRLSMVPMRKKRPVSPRKPTTSRPLYHDMLFSTVTVPSGRFFWAAAVSSWNSDSWLATTRRMSCRRPILLAQFTSATAR
ncbi:LOW QUALITY PROTEIN: hypothetical protein CRUP_013015 [Coryphaenoides rupestris]|nr:LOW QUALITY PROTEIN: hypothetical protein CRUP_013015 [Coryphaenoides rupestris]